MKFFYGFCFILFFSSTVKANELLRVGLIEGGRAPYFFAETDTRTGLYKDILKAVSRISGVEFSIRYYPQARLRKMMLSGSLDIEMGTDALWRQAKGEVEQSIYSIPFMTSTESWIADATNKNRMHALITTQGLARPCLVLGFNVEHNMKSASENVKGNSDLHLINMIAKKRCDLALIPDVILDYYQIKKDSRFVLSPAKKEHRLSIRLGSKHHAILPLINRALKQMLQSGELEKLMKKYGISKSQ